MASLDINTALDVATKRVIAKVLEETNVHELLIAAFLSEMQNSHGYCGI